MEKSAEQIRAWRQRDRDGGGRVNKAPATSNSFHRSIIFWQYSLSIGHIMSVHILNSIHVKIIHNHHDYVHGIDVCFVSLLIPRLDHQNHVRPVANSHP